MLGFFMAAPPGGEIRLTGDAVRSSYGLKGGSVHPDRKSGTPGSSSMKTRIRLREIPQCILRVVVPPSEV